MNPGTCDDARPVGKPIFEQQQIAAYLAEMKRCLTLRDLVLRAAWCGDTCSNGEY